MFDLVYFISISSHRMREIFSTLAGLEYRVFGEIVETLCCPSSTDNVAPIPEALTPNSPPSHTATRYVYTDSPGTLTLSLPSLRALLSLPWHCYYSYTGRLHTAGDLLEWAEEDVLASACVIYISTFASPSQSQSYPELVHRQALLRGLAIHIQHCYLSTTTNPLSSHH